MNIEQILNLLENPSSDLLKKIAVEATTLPLNHNLPFPNLARQLKALAEYIRKDNEN